MERVMLEQKTEDLNHDERFKNFIVHRLPESNQDTAEKRAKDEASNILELLTASEVADKPKQCTG